MNLKNHFYILLISAFFSLELSAQNINFNYTNGTSVSFSVDDVRKVTFNADVMTLILWNGAVFSWNVSTIEEYGYDAQIVSMEDIIENLNALNVIIYPNPAHEILEIRFNLSKLESLQFMLSDINGNNIITKNLGVLNSGEHHKSFEIAELASGIYFIKVSGASFHFENKIIIE